MAGYLNTTDRIQASLDQLNNYTPPGQEQGQGSGQTPTTTDAANATSNTPPVDNKPKANPANAPGTTPLAGMGDKPRLTGDPFYDEGLARGYLAKQGELRAQNAEKRAETSQSQTNELFSWEKEKHSKEKLIQEGMYAAAKDGGYSGVISFLEKSDPVRALQFTQAKTNLDASIMQNDVLKATSKRDIASAMFESYGLIGKMGYAILRMPPEMRQQAYDHIMPMVKAVVPDAPKKVTEASDMFLLAAAQSTPANQLFKWGKEQTQAQSTVGKIGADIKALTSQGVTADDNSVEGQNLKALYAEQQRWMSQSVNATQQITQTQLGMTQSKFKATETVSKNLQAVSPLNNNVVEAFTGIQGSLGQLAKDPDNSQAQQAVARSFARMINGAGVMTDPDVATAFSAYGAPALYKKAQSMASGKVVALNPTEIGDITNVVNNIMTSKVTYQKQVESQFQESTSKYGNLVDWNNVRKPSENMLKYQQNRADLNQAAHGKVPPNIQGEAQAKIQQIQADPNLKPQEKQGLIQQVNKKLEGLMGQMQQTDQLIKSQEERLTPKDYE